VDIVGVVDHQHRRVGVPVLQRPQRVALQRLDQLLGRRRRGEAQRVADDVGPPKPSRSRCSRRKPCLTRSPRFTAASTSPASPVRVAKYPPTEKSKCPTVAGFLRFPAHAGRLGVPPAKAWCDVETPWVGDTKTAQLTLGAR
jgi:hypothetical protein